MYTKVRFRFGTRGMPSSYLVLFLSREGECFAKSGQAGSGDEGAICDPEVSVPLDEGLGVEPRQDGIQEGLLLLCGSARAELGDPDRTVTTSGVGLRDMVLEVLDVGCSIVPVDGDEIDLAAKGVARIHKVGQIS